MVWANNSRLEANTNPVSTLAPDLSSRRRCALFGLPPLYVACRHALDALVEEVCVFAGSVVAGGATLNPKILIMILHARD